MKRNAFTLIEMLAVILLIALITIVALPRIVNQVTSQKENISKASLNLIYDANEIYLKENPEMYPMYSGDKYCVSLETLVNDGKLKKPITDMVTGNEIPLNKIVKTLVDEYRFGEYSLVDPGEC